MLCRADYTLVSATHFYFSLALYRISLHSDRWISRNHITVLNRVATKSSSRKTNKAVCSGNDIVVGNRCMLLRRRQRRYDTIRYAIFTVRSNAELSQKQKNNNIYIYIYI